MSQCCTRYTQTAVASFGPKRQKECGKMPAGFTRLTPEVLDWVQKTAGINHPGINPIPNTIPSPIPRTSRFTRNLKGIHDSFDEAYASVNKMKANSGDGVSTRIILHNETPESLFFTGYDDYAGYWGVRPPSEVKLRGVKEAFRYIICCLISIT